MFSLLQVNKHNELIDGFTAWPETHLVGQLTDTCSKPAIQRTVSQRYSADPCLDDINANGRKHKPVEHKPLCDESNYIEPMSLTERRMYLDVIDDGECPSPSGR